MQIPVRGVGHLPHLRWVSNHIPDNMITVYFGLVGVVLPKPNMVLFRDVIAADFILMSVEIASDIVIDC